jgi:hypothetical protein
MSACCTWTFLIRSIGVWRCLVVIKKSTFYFVPFLNKAISYALKQIKKMKKFTFLVATLFVALTLTSCGGEDENDCSCTITFETMNNVSTESFDVSMEYNGDCSDVRIQDFYNWGNQNGEWQQSHSETFLRNHQATIKCY